MSVERFPASVSPVVYALMCETADGSGYIKIGRSSVFGNRIKSIQTGCPLPIKKIAVIKTLNIEHSKVVEKAFHDRMQEKLSQGEWFSFDFKSSEDKEFFKRVTRDVFDRHLKGSRQLWWEIVNGEDDYLRWCLQAERNGRAESAKKKKKEASAVYWDGARKNRPGLKELLAEFMA